MATGITYEILNRDGQIVLGKYTLPGSTRPTYELKFPTDTPNRCMIHRSPDLEKVAAMYWQKVAETVE